MVDEPCCRHSVVRVHREPVVRMVVYAVMLLSSMAIGIDVNGRAAQMREMMK